MHVCIHVHASTVIMAYVPTILFFSVNLCIYMYYASINPKIGNVHENNFSPPHMQEYRHVHTHTYCINTCEYTCTHRVRRYME